MLLHAYQCAVQMCMQSAAFLAVHRLHVLHFTNPSGKLSGASSMTSRMSETGTPRLFQFLESSGYATSNAGHSAKRQRMKRVIFVFDVPANAPLFVTERGRIFLLLRFTPR